MMKFDWDSRKNSTNKKKHGISFEEALSCFYDPTHILVDDPDHAPEEGRMILIGLSHLSRLLVVVHAEVHQDDVRIISARKATKRERLQYEEV